MTEIRARVPPADRTLARFVEWARVVYPLRVLDVQLAARRESLTGATVARRQNTVKHVYATRYRLDQILWRSNAHQITRRFFWHSRCEVLNYVKHHRFLFADTQSADRVTVKTDVDGLFETHSSEIEVSGTLDDAEECLCAAQAFGFNAACVSAVSLQSLERCFRTLCPTRSQVHAAFCLFVMGLARSAFIKDHHDVRPERRLHFHRQFRRQKPE